MRPAYRFKSSQLLGPFVALLMVLTACETIHEEALVVTSEPILAESVALDSGPRTARVAKTRPLPATGGRSVRAGVVTAGDIDDRLNLTAFDRFSRRASKQTGYPRLNLSKPVSLQLVHAGTPMPGVSITLRRPGATTPFYSGQTGTDGRITVFPGLNGVSVGKSVELRVFDQGQQVFQTQTARVSTVNVPDVSQTLPTFLDLVFVFDTTGSMGDELQWLQKEFAGLIRDVRRQHRGVDMRFGLVAYRDQGDAYVVKNFGFTKRSAQMVGWLRSLDANGGGNYPEASDRALQAAMDLGWLRGNGKRLVFHVADAPAHKDRARNFLQQVRRAAEKDVQIYGLGASGVGDAAQLLMRQAAAASGGRYLFLTDDSGVGNAHAEPDVACYRVTALKSLIRRVLRSELSGKRIEARQNEILRSVGNYNRGRCAT